MRPVGRGDRGKQVVDIQTRLAALDYFLGREGADGLFGPHTENAIRAFQQQTPAVRRRRGRGQHLDRAGRGRIRAGRAPALPARALHARGRRALSAAPARTSWASTAGPWTASSRPPLEVAVTEFQRNAGLNVDGIVGETTLDRLRRLHQVTAPRSTSVGIPDRMDGYVGTEFASRAAGEHRPCATAASERGSREEAGRCGEGPESGSGHASWPSCSRARGRWSTCSAERRLSLRSTSGPKPPTPGSPTSTSVCITAHSPQPEGAGGRRLLLRQPRLSVQGGQASGRLHRRRAEPGTGPGRSAQARPQLRLPAGGEAARGAWSSRASSATPRKVRSWPIRRSSAREAAGHPARHRSLSGPALGAPRGRCVASGSSVAVRLVVARKMVKCVELRDERR